MRKAVRTTPSSRQPLDEHVAASPEPRSREARPAPSASPDVHVAARTAGAASAELQAHALPDIGWLTETCGVTTCGLLAGDEVVIVPGLRWQDVPLQFRCAACAPKADAAAERNAELPRTSGPSPFA